MDAEIYGKWVLSRMRGALAREPEDKKKATIQERIDATIVALTNTKTDVEAMLLCLTVLEKWYDAYSPSNPQFKYLHDQRSICNMSDAELRDALS